MKGVYVIRDGDSNPRIVVRSERVKEWLRLLADEAGFADRETCMFQLNVDRPFGTGITYHHEAPTLIIMVSNIENSRAEPSTFTGVSG